MSVTRACESWLCDFVCESRKWNGKLNERATAELDWISQLNLCSVLDLRVPHGIAPAAPETVMCAPHRDQLVSLSTLAGVCRDRVLLRPRNGSWIVTNKRERERERERDWVRWIATSGYLNETYKADIRRASRRSRVTKRGSSVTAKCQWISNGR